MNKRYTSITTPSPFKRLVFFLLTDLAVITASLYLSFQLRLDFAMTPEYRAAFVYALPFFAAVKILVSALFRIYRITWRYTGIEDLLRIIASVAVSEFILMITFVLIIPDMPGADAALPPGANVRMPRSIFPIDGAISILLFSGIRISKRITLNAFRKQMKRKNGKKTLIIGAGDTGEMILRDMLRQENPEFCPVGFIDGDGTKTGSYIHGVRVLGTLDDLKEAVSVHRISQVIIAVPSLNHKALKSIYDSIINMVDSIKIVPRIYGFDQPNVNLRNLEEIKIEGIIGRQAVEIDHESIRDFVRKKVVLVTGAGGSIGSEIVLQVAGYQPEAIILYDIDETELHTMEVRLKRSYPQHFGEREGAPGVPFIGPAEKFVFVVGDIRNGEKVNSVCAAFKPEIVFHAAAYKHVPMMEHNPEEAIRVNMFGTSVVAKAAVAHGVKKFIMISTDKAVCPTSVMGATKRMAENICTALGGNGTEFISVRFGNVLGSRGSVLPLFIDQLKSGGPITVTHRDVKRYFMTIPEATSLVLQASVMGSGGDILVLDMGKPVRIAEIAEELIRLSGLEPYKDIDIEFIGLRPGEKLYEEMFTRKEISCRSDHEKIFRARVGGQYSISEIERIFMELESKMWDTFGSNGQLKELLMRYVNHLSEDSFAAASRGGFYNDGTWT